MRGCVVGFPHPQLKRRSEVVEALLPDTVKNKAMLLALGVDPEQIARAVAQEQMAAMDSECAQQ